MRRLAGSDLRLGLGRAFLRFAPEGNPLKCEWSLFWTAMGSAGIAARMTHHLTRG